MLLLLSLTGMIVRRLTTQSRMVKLEVKITNGPLTMMLVRKRRFKWVFHQQDQEEDMEVLREVAEEDTTMIVMGVVTEEIKVADIIHTAEEHHHTEVIEVIDHLLMVAIQDMEVQEDLQCTIDLEETVSYYFTWILFNNFLLFNP